MEEGAQNAEELFAVFAEVEGHEKPMIKTHLSFGRLMDDVIVPYESNDAFIIDGALIKKDRLKKMKIIQQKVLFDRTFNDLHWAMRFHSDLKVQKLYADQYHVRLGALLREFGEDVTSQVIKAFDNTIRPSLKDYLPKREELINATMKLFLESVKTLGGT